LSKSEVYAMPPAALRWLPALLGVALGYGVADARAGGTITDRLRRTATIEQNHEVPLRSVLDYVSYCTGLPIVIDLEAFKHAPDSPEEPEQQDIRLRKAKEIPVHLLLDRILDQTGAAWTVANGRIVVVPQRPGLLSPQFPADPNAGVQIDVRLRTRITTERELVSDLDTVLDMLAEKCGLYLDLDEVNLRAMPGSLMNPGQAEVRLPVLRDVPAHEALADILRQVGAGWVVQHGRVVVVPFLMGWTGPLPSNGPYRSISQTLSRLRDIVELKPVEELGGGIWPAFALDQLRHQTGIVFSIDVAAHRHLWMMGTEDMPLPAVRLRRPIRLPLGEALRRVTEPYGLTYHVTNWGRIEVILNRGR
jgi:hypothetical protein